MSVASRAACRLMVFVAAAVLAVSCASDAEPYESTYDPVVESAPFGPLRPGVYSKELRVAVLSDDSAVGSSCDSEQSYTDILSTSLNWDITVDAVPSSGYAVSAGDPGAVVSQRASRMLGPGSKPFDFIVLQAGAADVGSSSGSLVVGVQNAITAVRANAPGIPILVVGILNGANSIEGDVERNYRDIARVALAADGVGFLPTFDFRFAAGPNPHSPILDGCQQIASLIIEYLERIHALGSGS